MASRTCLVSYIGDVHISRDFDKSALLDNNAFPRWRSRRRIKSQVHCQKKTIFGTGRSLIGGVDPYFLRKRELDGDVGMY